MAKLDIANRLKKSLAKVENVKFSNEKIDDKLILEEEENTLQLNREHFDFSFINEIECDEGTKDFLRDKSVQLMIIQGKTVLDLGKICKEVVEELGRKGSPEGIYVKWLDFNGLKKDTALRARKRYELFNLATNSKLKEIIVLLKVVEIENLYKEKDGLMELLNSEENLELKRVREIIGNLLSLTPQKLSNKMEIHDIEENMERFNNIMRNLKTVELSETKKEKLEIILIQLEKLLG